MSCCTRYAVTPLVFRHVYPIGLPLQNKDVSAITIWTSIRQQRFKSSSFDHDLPHFMCFIVSVLPQDGVSQRVVVQEYSQTSRVLQLDQPLWWDDTTSILFVII